jgi:hypothetical protein
MARKGIIIGVVVAIAVLAGLYVIGLNASTNNGSTTPGSNEGVNQSQTSEVTSSQPAEDTTTEDQEEAKIAQLVDTYPWMDRPTAEDIVTGGTKMPDALWIHIITDTSWSGVAQGSDFVQQSDDGFGRGVNIVTCEPAGIYSVVYQLGSDTGDMRIVVHKNGEVLKHGYTDADYGVVSVSGTC